ncbi:hypothetical protein DIPPA_08475 [Diplonema papillatum]|nr:hypothetical protein DIPPA_08475 [Diplonema papillatum]
MEFPDVHHKMSKKIAQLTKVIYHLNTKNDDNEHQMQQITDMYETEIEDILADARRKIITFKEQLEVQKSHDKAQLALSEMTRVHQKEKSDIVQEYTVFKKKTLENERALKLQSEKTISKLTAEVQKLKDGFQSRYQAFAEGQRGLEQKGYDALEELRKLKDGELEGTIQEYNEKYKAMLAKQMQLRDEDEQRLAEGWTAKLKEEEGRRAAVELQLQAALKEAKDDKAKADGRDRDAKEQLEKQKREVAVREDSISALKDNEERLNKGLQDALKRLGSAETSRDMYKAKSDDLSVALEQAQAEIVSLQTRIGNLTSDTEQLAAGDQEKLEQLQQLRKEIESLTRELEDKTQHHAAAAAESETLLQNTVSELASSKEHAGTLEAAVRRLETDVKNLRLALEAKEKEAVQLKSALDALQHESDGRIGDLSESIRGLEASLAATENSALQSKTSLSKDMDDRLRRLGAEHRAQVEAAAARHKEALADSDERHARAAEAAKAERGAERQRLERDAEALRAEIAGLQRTGADAATASAAEAEALRAEMEDAANRAAKTAADLGEHLTAKEEEAAVLKEKLAEAGAALRATEAEKLAAEDALRASQARADGLSAECDALRDSIRAQGEEMKQAGEQELSRIRREKDAQLQSTIAAELQQQRVRLEVEHAKNLQTERDRLLARHADDAKKQQTEREQERRALNQLIDDLRRQLKLAEADSSTTSEKMAAERDALREKMQGMAADFKRKEAELKAGFAENLDQLTERLHAEHGAALAANKAELEESMAQLRREHVAGLQSLMNTHENDLADLKAAHAKALKQALAQKEEEHGQATARLLQQSGEKHGGEVRAVRGEYEAMLDKRDEAAAALREKLAATELSRGKLELALSEEKAGRTKDVYQAKLDAESAVAEHRAAIQRLDESNRNEVRALQETHQQAVNKLAGDFADIQNAMKQKHQHLQRVIAELEYKYANRESREEDVLRINSLMADVEAKDEALVKAYNELRWYKLELVNREENYNKVFGRQPTVAGAKPAASAAEADQKRYSTAADGKTAAPLSRGTSMVLKKLQR